MRYQSDLVSKPEVVAYSVAIFTIEDMPGVAAALGHSVHLGLLDVQAAPERRVRDRLGDRFEIERFDDPSAAVARAVELAIERRVAGPSAHATR